MISKHQRKSSKREIMVTQIRLKNQIQVINLKKLLQILGKVHFITQPLMLAKLKLIHLTRIEIVTTAALAKFKVLKI